MSAAVRKRIAGARRKRLVESKKEPEPSLPEVPKPKRKLSAAGKAAVVEATKQR